MSIFSARFHESNKSEVDLLIHFFLIHVSIIKRLACLLRTTHVGKKAIHSIKKSTIPTSSNTDKTWNSVNVYHLTTGKHNYAPLTYMKHKITMYWFVAFRRKRKRIPKMTILVFLEIKRAEWHRFFGIAQMPVYWIEYSKPDINEL